MHKFIPLILSCSAYAAQNCNPTSPVECNPATCEPCYCLGPIGTQGNAPVHPYTCDGDFVVSASALYWKAHQDGLEFGLFEDHRAEFSVMNQQISALPIIDAEYIRPSQEWNFGFNFGIAYNSSCDGWDIRISWTSYVGKQKIDQKSIHPVTIPTTSSTPFWSAYQNISTGALPLNQGISHWKLYLNDFPLEFGREFWVSRYLSLRPSIGLRYISLNQNYQMQFMGDAWNENFSPPGVNSFVILKNNYQGIAPFLGLNSNWHLSCGWSIYGDLSAGIIYGQFSINHNEFIREAVSPFSKTKILETNESFRASRPLLNMALGLKYSALVCDCQYGITAQLGWEQHLYYHQNQMWRVVRNMGETTFSLPNDTGENDFTQSCGTLSTGGLTLKVAFAF